ncbi:MAG: hypothetical protein EOO87_18410 [Pedobacter sp.]|nr:MAG: hypothetical protein EOO87_18410 [Pedobacter sp.]
MTTIQKGLLIAMICAITYGCKNRSDYKIIEAISYKYHFDTLLNEFVAKTAIYSTFDENGNIFLTKVAYIGNSPKYNYYRSFLKKEVFEKIVNELTSTRTHQEQTIMGFDDKIDFIRFRLGSKNQKWSHKISDRNVIVRFLCVQSIIIFGKAYLKKLQKIGNYINLLLISKNKRLEKIPF